jgi:hypothetical protein
MSVECGECERDLRGEHDEDCVLGLKGHVKSLERDIKEADALVSQIHDSVYAEPFDREAANRTIWKVHSVLREAINPPDAL